MNANHHVIRATVISDITSERRRQIEAEGWTPEHDDEHSDGEMGRAAASYAVADMGQNTQRASVVAELWPWDFQWWKPTTYRRNLVKAAALIVAEIERLDRASGMSASGQDAQRLEAKPASPTREAGDAPDQSHD